MTREKEAFLDRWSRMKRDQSQETSALPIEKAEKIEKEEPAAALPSVEELRPDSDFVPFMNPNVEPGIRRAALKKLFADAHFNVPDRFEAYSDDYTFSEPIPEAMLAAINKARDLVLKTPEQAAEERKPAVTAPPEEVQGAAEEIEAPKQEPDDVAGKQDA